MVMRSSKEISAVIETDGKPIPVEDLSSFLYYFRAAYAMALVNYPRELHTEAMILDENNSAMMRLRRDLKGMHSLQISNLAHKELYDDNLGIIDIRRENPLTIVFEGITSALAIAVIISGGKFSLGPLKVKLPPLGHGIDSLRTAFGQKPKRRSPRNRS